MSGNVPNAEIEVTPEMIEAGVAAYEAWKPDDFAWQYTEENLVREIINAVCEKWPFSLQKGTHPVG